jgi:hypothetical protein
LLIAFILWTYTKNSAPRILLVVKNPNWHPELLQDFYNSRPPA